MPPPKLTLDDVRHRATITIEETSVVLGIGRTLAYEAARRGQLPVLALGTRRLVAVPALLKMLGDGADDAAIEPESSSLLATAVASSPRTDPDSTGPRRHLRQVPGP